MVDRSKYRGTAGYGLRELVESLHVCAQYLQAYCLPLPSGFPMFEQIVRARAEKKSDFFDVEGTEFDYLVALGADDPRGMRLGLFGGDADEEDRKHGLKRIIDEAEQFLLAATALRENPAPKNVAKTIITEMTEPKESEPPADRGNEISTSPLCLEPKKLLEGWHAIAAAVGMLHKRRRDIKSLNDRYEGPIKNKGAGTRPMVYHADLIEWWNRLASKQQELANQRDGAKLSGESQHNYGRDGRAAPEIGGGVKKRRQDKKT